MRKLASIQIIKDVRPIPDAEKIECASVLGWEIVVRKEEGFKAGDKIVYIETDSIVPIRPEFEFLRDRKFRVRTIRLRKQVSQGIIFPLSILPSGKYKEDQDVTEDLGITKYDPEAAKEALLEAQLAAINKNRIDKFLKRYGWYRRFFTKAGKRGWPQFIKKTDEDRIQLFPYLVETEKGTPFYCTEKLDGQSATYGLLRLPKKWYQLKPRYQFFVCSRNLHLRTPYKCSYWDIALKYQIKDVLCQLIKDNEFIVLQGEIIGPGIQSNKYKFEELEFYAFNLVYSSVGRVNYMLMDFTLRETKIKCVPLLSNSLVLGEKIPDCVSLAKGKSVLTDIYREGVVLRHHQKGISFKIINPDFLLTYQDEDEAWQEGRKWETREI